jgi:predicted phosphodiesterase
MPTKFLIITDVHANLPALTAVLEVTRQEGYERIVHTGDAIGIGPYPAECQDTLLNIPHLDGVMGNHDAWFVEGLPQPPPPEMDAEEVRHHQWTHQALDPAWRARVAAWPYSLTREVEGVPTTFIHYGLRSPGPEFAPVLREPDATALDELFAPHASQVIFYGHDHRPSDLQGRARYVNPGSLGCHSQPVARYAVATFHSGQCTVEQRAVSYDDGPLRAAFAARNVPDRAVIYRLFFGGRFPAP